MRKLASEVYRRLVLNWIGVQHSTHSSFNAFASQDVHWQLGNDIPSMIWFVFKFEKIVSA